MIVPTGSATGTLAVAAWPFVIDADPRGFVHALATRGYFTAPENAYLAGLEARLSQLEAMDLPDPEGGP